MATTDNQLIDIWNHQLQRDPTNFEKETFKTASPQKLATIKDTYSKLNTNSSISDYLQSIGQDNSLQARMKLGQQYGIPNVGTAEGNSALLQAMKAGKPPVQPVGGTVSAASPAGSNIDPATGMMKQPDVKLAGTQIPPVTLTTPTPETHQDVNLAGSVSEAAGNPPPAIPGTIDADPDVMTAKDTTTQALTAYQNYQRQVADIDAQVAQLRSTISGALKDKEAQAAASGGVVSRSQIAAEVANETAGIQRQISDLLAQRAPLAQAQSQASTSLNQARNDLKDAQANYYKNISASQAQQKIEAQAGQFATKEQDVATKNAIQQQQFTQKEADVAAKLEQSAWKAQKINVMDAAGNVTGQKVVWTENPANGVKIAGENAAQYTPTSAGDGGIKNGITTMGNTAAIPKLTLADGATPEQVLQSLISGPSVPVKGLATPLDQQTLYMLAVQDMLGVTSSAGGRTPSGAILAVKEKENDILNAYGLTAFDAAAAKEQMKSITAANTALMATAAFTKTYASTANDNLQLALNQSDAVARSGAKIVNNYTQWVQGNFTPAGDLAAFETYIYTAAREYAKVTSGGAKSSAGLTDSAQAEASKLLNAAQSPEVFARVVQAMQADMNNVINNFDKQTGKFPDAVKALFGLAGQAGTATPGQDKLTSPSGNVYDMTGYATDPQHTAKVEQAIADIGKLNSPQDITNYISQSVPNSPITADMINQAAGKYGVGWEEMLGLMKEESQLGTAGVAVKTFNPGNIGNTDSGQTKNYGSWQAGVDAVAQELAKRKKKGEAKKGQDNDPLGLR